MWRGATASVEAAAVASCAACVEGAGKLAGHTGKHKLSLGTRGCEPRKKKAKASEPTRVTTRASERELAKRDFYSKDAEHSTEVRHRRRQNAQGTRSALKIRRVVKKLLAVHFPSSRFVVEATKVVADAVKTQLLATSPAAVSAKAKPSVHSLSTVMKAVRAVVDVTAGDLTLTGAVAETILSYPPVAAMSIIARQIAARGRLEERGQHGRSFRTLLLGNTAHRRHHDARFCGARQLRAERRLLQIHQEVLQNRTNSKWSDAKVTLQRHALAHEITRRTNTAPSAASDSTVSRMKALYAELNMGPGRLRAATGKFEPSTLKRCILYSSCLCSSSGFRST